MMQLNWVKGERTPEWMSSQFGVATAHKNTAYFSAHYNIYSYTIQERKWMKLQPCQYEYFAMAVINDKLTTIGGFNSRREAVNTLLSYTERVFRSTWREIFPQIPTKRMRPASAVTPTHLVVAGGEAKLFGENIATIEVLNIDALEWSTATSLPQDIFNYPELTICGECFYLSKDNNVFSCSVEDLVNYCKTASSSCAVWTRLAKIPVISDSRATLVVVKDCLLAVGGSDDVFFNRPTGTIHLYNEKTNSWSSVSEMPTPRHDILATVLPNNHLMVVGGTSEWRHPCHVTETCTPGL